MKATFTLLFTLVLLSPVFGQKLKLKKGEISVDKVPTFKIEKIPTEEQPKYALLSLQGDTLITFSPVTKMFPQLPYEKIPRKDFTYAVADFKTFGEQVNTMYLPGFTRGIFQVLKYAKAIDGSGLKQDAKPAMFQYLKVEETKNALLRHERALAARQANFEKTKARFGAFPTRASNLNRLWEGEIKNGITRLAYWKLHKTSASGKVFHIKRKDDPKEKQLATVAYQQKQVIVTTTVDGLNHVIPYSPINPGPEIDLVLKYLIDFGYL